MELIVDNDTRCIDTTIDDDNDNDDGNDNGHVKDN